jgi:hypothetical protein
MNGDTLQFSAATGGGAFTQTATTATLPDKKGTSNTYSIVYGHSTGGIAQYAAVQGKDSKGCAERFTFTHN